MCENNTIDFEKKAKEAKKGKDRTNSSKPRTSSDDKPKINQGIIEEYLVRYLVTGKIQPFMPSFLPYEPLAVRFFKADTKSATRMITVDKTSNTAQEIDEETLMKILLENLGRFAIEGHACSIYSLKYAQIKDLARRLKTCAPSIEVWPEPCGFKNDPRLLFERLNFDPKKTAKPDAFPFIKEMLARMTNADAFCQRIGSLFHPDADRKQATILYGQGDGGKTTLFNMICRLVGERAVAPINETISRDSFGLWTLVDKRVWIGEEILPSFFRTNTFKRLTGGAPLMINPKNEKQYSAHLKGILFANANEAPLIPNDSGLINRLIICQVDSIPAEKRLPTVDVERMIEQELPAFTGYCIGLYKGGAIEAKDKTEIQSAIEDYEAPLKLIFDMYFRIDPGAFGVEMSVTAADVVTAWAHARDNFPGRVGKLSIENFRSYISRQTGRDGMTFTVRKKRDGHTIRLVPGLIKKPNLPLR